MVTDVVVVGSGYAGTTAVAEFESIEAQIDLTWVSRDPEHVVRHEMHRVLRTPAVADGLRIPTDRLHGSSTTFVEGTVTGIATGDRQLQLATGETVSYDYLLLTVGARAAYYGIPGLADHSETMETIEDALAIHEQVDETLESGGDETPTRVVVGGGGLTGVQTAGEVAALARERSAPVTITVVEALDSVLPSSPTPLQERVGAKLADADIRVVTGRPIVEATADAVILDDEEHLPYDMLLWTGGITGRDFVLETGLETERHRLLVDETLRTSDARVFAVGDIALIEQGDGFAPPTAQAAWQAAPVAARNVLARARDQQPEAWRFRDKGTLVSVGDAAIAHDVMGVPVETFGGLPAQTLKKLVATRWIASVTSWPEAARLWSAL